MRTGALMPELAALAPTGQRRMGANPHANGGLLLRDLRLPDFRDYAVDVSKPGAVTAEATTVMGAFLRDVDEAQACAIETSASFGPDETTSNRLARCLEVTDRVWMAERDPDDDHLAPDGRVMEILSEHTCQGWLEGYLLTGRHGLFSCYEAFIHIVDSMFNQHAKWLKTAHEIPWRRPIASLNYLLTSHVWRQDHNGFSHQDPGFIDHVVNKKADIIRVYLPPDANTLLSVTDHCLRSRNYVNVIVAGKQPAPAMARHGRGDETLHGRHRHLGMGEQRQRRRAGRGDGLRRRRAHAGDAGGRAALREYVPSLKIRVVNVVDLMKLQPTRTNIRTGCRTSDFDTFFTTDKPIIFAYHGYPWLIHRLTYRRTNHKNLHVRGYKEEGTTTTPFDMVFLNDMDRFHLAADVIERVRLGFGGGLCQTGHPRQADRTQGIHQKVRRRHAGDPELEMDRRPAACGNPRVKRCFCHSRACVDA